MKKGRVDISGEGLDNFLNEILEDLKLDIDEADDNITQYKTAVSNHGDNGLQMYGELLNDSLKIKGSARDRVIKLLSIAKDRVKSKEDKEKEKGNDGFDFSAEQIQNLAKKIFKESNEK